MLLQFIELLDGILHSLLLSSPLIRDDVVLAKLLLEVLVLSDVSLDLRVVILVRLELVLHVEGGESILVDGLDVVEINLHLLGLLFLMRQLPRLLLHAPIGLSLLLVHLINANNLICRICLNGYDLNH